MPREIAVFAWYTGLLVCPGISGQCAPSLRSKRMRPCFGTRLSPEEFSISEGIIVTEALAIKIGVLNYEYDLAT